MKMKGTPDPELLKLMQQVKPIIRLAGEILMNYFQHSQQTPEFIQYKSDNSPVTEADMASHIVLIEELKRLTPDIPIISEEDINWSFEQRQDFHRVWIIDPLDGTKEFIAGNPEFTIHIGLAEYGNPVLGLVYAPAFEKLYYAVKNGGAHLEQKEINSSIQSSNVDLTAAGLRVVHSKSHMNSATEMYINTLNVPKCTAMGSSLKIMAVAEGKQDIYPKLKSEMKEWDTCAPQIILEEAGGIMVCLEKGKPLTYNKEDMVQPDFIAMGKLMAYYEY
jgi:3'(2'), 5'-bisphosphate nucleotidase